MSSSLGESNRHMVVRSSPKLFWNGVPNSIIRTKRQIILSGTLFQNNFEELRTIMPRLLPANDEAMDFFNTLTQGNLISTPRRSSTLDPSTTLDSRPSTLYPSSRPSTARRSTTLYPSSRPSTPSCHVCLVSKDSTKPCLHHQVKVTGEGVLD